MLREDVHGDKQDTRHRHAAAQTSISTIFAVHPCYVDSSAVNLPTFLFRAIVTA